jgi:hypothetical protein
MPIFTQPNEETPIQEENWIAGAIKRPGQLHRDLGVPQGKKIPKGMIAAAAKKKGKIGQRARLAQTLAGFSHGGSKTKESNDCHTPAGSPAGGQFCSGKGGGGDSWARSGGGSGGDFAATMGAANKHAAAKKGGSLAEWEKGSRYAVTRHPDGSISVPYGVEPHFNKLWGLSDYRVTSVTGGSVWLMPKKAEAKTASGPSVRDLALQRQGGPARQLKVITSHAGISRYRASVKPAGWIARTGVASPYASGPSHQVFDDPRRGKVFISEISHRRYAVFEVPKGLKIHTTDEEATREYMSRGR